MSKTKYLKPFEELSKRQQFRRLKQEMALALMKNESFTVETPTSKKFMATNIIRITPSTIKKHMVRKAVTKTNASPSTSEAQVKDEVLPMANDKQESFEENDQFEEVSNDEVFLEEYIQHDSKRQKVNSGMVKIPAENIQGFLSQDFEHSEHGENCCGACRDKLDMIYNQQCEILQYLKSGLYNSSKVEKLDLLPSMPFTNVNEFLDFDESLINENVQDQFINKLRKLLVSTEQKTIGNIMSSIVTNELCKTISWIGIKDTLAFGSTNMVRFIVDIIQDHHSLDVDVVRGRIAEWLRRCGDRISNEIRKMQRKRVL